MCDGLTADSKRFLWAKNVAPTFAAMPSRHGLVILFEFEKYYFADMLDIAEKKDHLTKGQNQIVETSDH